MTEGVQPILTVDQYIFASPATAQGYLHQMRSVIRSAVPDAIEKISYKMPAYFYKGVLVYFGVNKNHIGFYPTPSGIDTFRDQLAEYHYSRGAIQFPFHQPLPIQLIKKIVLFRIKENNDRFDKRNSSR